jgi:hypothetical protein
VRNKRQGGAVGCASTIKIKSFLFCIVFGFHYLCNDLSLRTKANEEFIEFIQGDSASFYPFLLWGGGLWSAKN